MLRPVRFALRSMRSFSALVSRIVSVVSRSLYLLIIITLRFQIQWVRAAARNYGVPEKSQDFLGRGATARKAKLLPPAAKRTKRANCAERTAGRSACPGRSPGNRQNRRSRKRPEFALLPAHRRFIPTPRRKRHKSPVNRRQGRKERLGRTDWGYTDLTVTNGTFVTGRKGIFNFQQSCAVAAVAAKADAEIGKAVFP